MSEQNNPPTQESPDNGNDNCQNPELPKSKDGWGVQEVCEAFIGAIFLGIGQLFGSEFPNCGTIISALGLICLVHMLELRCEKKWGNNSRFRIGAVTVSTVICLIAGFVIWTRFSPKPSPRFVFSLRRINPPGELIRLTNDFLLIKNDKFRLVTGLIIFPIEYGQSNLTLRFGVDNESSIAAENPVGVLRSDKDLDLKLDDGWVTATMKNAYSITLKQHGVSETNADKAWANEFPTILSGNGLNFPDIHFSSPPMMSNGSVKTASLNLEVQSKSTPLEGIAFQFITFQMRRSQTNSLPVVLDQGTSGNFKIPVEILEQLKK